MENKHKLSLELDDYGQDSKLSKSFYTDDIVKSPPGELKKSLEDLLEKAKKMPVGTVSKGRKKVDEGKWVDVTDSYQKKPKVEDEKQSKGSKKDDEGGKGSDSTDKAEKKKVKQWVDKNKEMFDTGEHAHPDRSKASKFLRAKGKGFVSAVKHEAEHLKESGVAIKKALTGKHKSITPHEKKALKKVGISLGLTAATMLATGGVGAFSHGFAATAKHLGIHFVEHGLLESAGLSAIFAKSEDGEELTDEEIEELFMKLGDIFTKWIEEGNWSEFADDYQDDEFEDSDEDNSEQGESTDKKETEEKKTDRDMDKEELRKSLEDTFSSLLEDNDLEKGKALPIGHINKYGEKKMPNGEWKYVGKGGTKSKTKKKQDIGSQIQTAEKKLETLEGRLQDKYNIDQNYKPSEEEVKKIHQAEREVQRLHSLRDEVGVLAGDAKEEMIGESRDSQDSKPTGKLLSKLKEKEAIARKAIEQWGGSYEKTLNRVRDVISGKESLDYKNPLRVQGDTQSRQNYDVFNSSNLREMSGEVANIVSKYKQHEVEQSSTGAAEGWSGTMKATVGGNITPETNFSAKNTNFIIGVKIGQGINSEVKDKLMNELYETFYKYDQFNTEDGGVSVQTTSGTNWSAIGLTSSKFQLPEGVAQKYEQMMKER